MCRNKTWIKAPQFELQKRNDRGPRGAYAKWKLCCHSANCRATSTSTSTARSTSRDQCVVCATYSKTWPSVNGCILAAGCKCQTEANTERETDRKHEREGATLKQNMITIKTLYTWRIYIIHFAVGFSCHISPHFPSIHFLHFSFCCMPHSSADTHLHVSMDPQPLVMGKPLSLA